MSLALRNMTGAVYVSDVRRYISDIHYTDSVQIALSEDKGKGVIAHLHACRMYVQRPFSVS